MPIRTTVTKEAKRCDAKIFNDYFIAFLPSVFVTQL